MSQISSLKSNSTNREVDGVTFETLKREIFPLSEVDKEPHDKGLVTKQALNDMTIENQKLRDEIYLLKAGEYINSNGSALTLFV